MIRFIFFSFIVIIFSFQSNAQFTAEMNKFADIKYFQDVVSKQDNSNDYSEIKGSPYLTDKFIISKVCFKNDSAFKIGLRYNIFDNRFEFKHNNKVYSITNPEVVKRIEMDNKVFIYYYRKDNGLMNSFYELLVTGESHLLVKKSIGFKKAEPPKPIIETEPAKFFKRKDAYYIIVESSLPFFINSKSSLIKAFSSKKELISKFIKKERISYKKRKDLIKLVQYYNSLKF